MTLLASLEIGADVLRQGVTFVVLLPLALVSSPPRHLQRRRCVLFRRSPTRKPSSRVHHETAKSMDEDFDFLSHFADWRPNKVSKRSIHNRESYNLPAPDRPNELSRDKSQLNVVGPAG